MILAALSFIVRGTAAFALLVPFICFVQVYAALMVAKAFSVLPVLMLGGEATVQPIIFFEKGIGCYAAIFGN